MSAIPRPTPIERFAAGDDTAAVALISETLAPTFDLAFHCCGNADRAGEAAYEACSTLLRQVRTGQYRAPEPLAATAASVIAWAQREDLAPFSEPFAFEESAALGCSPTDKRLGALSGAPVGVRRAVATAVAMDLADSALAYALGVPLIEATSAVEAGLCLIPSETPLVRLRDLMDLRASAVRIPRGTEDRILAPYESD